MNWNTRITTGLMLAAMMAACTPSQHSSEPEVAQPGESTPEPAPAAEYSESTPAAPAPAAAPDTAAGSMVVYTCDDGSGLTVTYDEYAALVKLPTGSTMLSRAESGSNGGNEAYLGEELSLYRNGNLVQLQVAGKSRNCTRSPSNG